MLRTSDDDCRDYFAGELKDSIDRSIKDELGHLPPQGYKSRPYDPAQWQEYWNDRIYYNYDLGASACHGKYRGPNGHEFIAYILQQRRANGLPELIIEVRNRDRLP